MNLYYKDKKIKENISEEKSKEAIKIYILNRKEYYNKLYDKIEDYSEKIEEIRPRKKFETIKEYNTFLKENNKEILDDLEKIGKLLYKEEYDSFYFLNSSEDFIGLNIIKNGIKEMVPFTVLPLECLNKIPNKSDFYIKNE